MKRLQAILFDMDGTLTDLNKRWITPLESELKKIKPDYNKKRLEENFPKIIELSGKPSKILIPRLIWVIGSLAGLSPYQRIKLLTHLHQRREDFKRVVLLPGAQEVVEQLKREGYKLGLVTTASKDTINQGKKQSGLFNLFDVIITRNDVKNIKPAPEPIFLACEGLQVDPRKVVMIGDSPLDIKAGKQAGTKTIAVAGEFEIQMKPLLEKEKPDIVVRTIRDVLPAIKRIEQNIKA